AAVVEAEAVFDAVYFMDMSKNVQDRPVPSELVGSRVDVFSLNGGIRKPLPSGGQLTTRLNISRTSTDNQFQLIDPVYTSDFVAELAHPLLRNSGLDFNRSLISVARNDLRISRQAFKRQVRDILFATEEAYWRLVQTRREVLIQARLLSEFERTYDYLWQRRDFDVYQIQLSQTRAELERSRADFIRVVNQVYDAQDVLLAIMNDPTLNLVDEVELIPSAFPSAGPLEIDRVAAVREALENRTEVIEARLRIENAGLVVGRAKNQAMPRLDLLFRYTVNGLGVDADAAFSQVTQSDFMDYFVALDFELPMGNRSRKAAWRRARLRHAQAIATLKAQIENVVLDVNTSVRAIRTAYDRIEPSLRSAEANEEQVASTIARQERKDFSALNQELNARRALAGSRSALLADLVEYNIAIIAFERAKETLLNYNSIVLAGEDQGGGSVEVLPDTPE
ncbi:MAG: TolC family protein, partial [Phycisphaerae bacterium]